MDFDAILWDFIPLDAKWRNIRGFLSAISWRLFLSCSRWISLWISLWAARLGKPAESASQAASSAISRSRLPVGRRSASTLRKSASAMTVALPLPIRQRATIRDRRSCSRRRRSSARRGGLHRPAAKRRLRRPALLGRIEPQAPMPQQAGVGESRRRAQRIAERPARSASRASDRRAARSRPPPRTHASSSTSSSAGCARGWAISSSAAARAVALGDVDRLYVVALLERRQRRRAAAVESEALAQHQRQAGQQEQGGLRTLGRRPGRRSPARQRRQAQQQGRRCRPAALCRSLACCWLSFVGRGFARRRRRARPAARSARLGHC